MRYSREQYSGANVCNTQDDFNVAFNKAIKQNNKDAMKKAGPWVYVYIVLYLVFFVWALLLAMQNPAGPSRIVHLVFAMVFSPIYVISYYLGAMGDMSGVPAQTMGMRRRYY
jgi:hypothetical protein